MMNMIYCYLDIRLDSLVEGLIPAVPYLIKNKAIIREISHTFSLGQGALGGSRTKLMMHSGDES